MHVRIRGHGQRAAGNGAAFGDVHGCSGQHGRVIGPVDGHGQGVGGCGAVIVGHREGKAVGQAFPHAQSLHRGQGIVQGIGIVAVGVHAERAVAARRVCLRNKTHHIVQIRVRRSGQHSADAGRIFNNGSRGRCYSRRVVGTVDGHGQDVGGCGAVIVGHREGKAVGEALPHSQALYHGKRIIQRVGVVAGGVHAERAVEARRVCLRNKTHHIMQIRVRRGRQRTADRRRVLGNGGCSRSHGGRVIAAVDAHGHDRGRRAAVVVR